MSKSIVVQLARLGDLMQSAPAILSLSLREANTGMDVLCADPLTVLARCLPGVERAVGWDGIPWRRLAETGAISEADHAMRTIAPEAYDTAYNLNQHNRAKLAAHLLARRVIGPGEHGPVSTDLPPWAAYLGDVAKNRGKNRVHLADVWCGFCGVRPPGCAPRLNLPDVAIPQDLDEVLHGNQVRIAVAMGAGDRERMVPVETWAGLITELVRSYEGACVILVGTRGEQEMAAGVERRLDPVTSARVWNATGRTTLLELARALQSCAWVVAADTGPLHLATMVGARAVGFYFARARVHETGPYGNGHWVWQAEGADGFGSQVSGLGAQNSPTPGTRNPKPASWPIKETVELILDGHPTAEPDGWRLWVSRMDEWGVFYQKALGPAEEDCGRRRIWERLSGSDNAREQTCVGDAP